MYLDFESYIHSLYTFANRFLSLTQWLVYFLSLFQIEKVLQQGEISECADPYMTLKESDNSKVINEKLTTEIINQFTVHFPFTCKHFNCGYSIKCVLANRKHFLEALLNYAFDTSEQGQAG